MKRKKTALVILAPGFEELEAVAVIDILRRAGVEVVAAGTEPGPIRAQRGVRIIPDEALDEVMDRSFDLVVLPGGLEGTENLARDDRVAAILTRQLKGGGRVGAICAAPTVLDRHGLATGVRITCHPVVRSSIKRAELSGALVVTDGLITTGTGPGAAVEFALELVAHLLGPDEADSLREALVAERPA